MKKQLFLILIAVILLTANLFAQSKDESRPTTVSGTTIKTTLIDDNPQNYQAYYFSMNLAAGRYSTFLKVKTKDCDGSFASFLVDGTGGNVNATDAKCDDKTGIAFSGLDFNITRSGKHIITIYVTGGDNESFDIELSFHGSGEGKPAPTGNGQICTYSDNFSLSDARPLYERTFDGLVFQKGSAQMLITAVNDEGTNISGTVYAEQTDKGQYNENFVLPVDGFGGTIGTPLNNAEVREVQQISGKGKGYIKIKFEQNGNSIPKTGHYKLIVQGTGIASCGSGGTSTSLPNKTKPLPKSKKKQ